MRLALFGGSFDPPHRGHLGIALAAADAFSLDRILFAPTGRQPFKRGGASASFADRLAMVELACQGEDRFLASAIDAPHADGSANYTVEVLAGLRSSQPEASLFAIIGADGLPELPRWRDAGRLFDLATWIAVSRPEYPFPEPLPAMLQHERDRGRLHLLDGVELPVSSTTLRGCLGGVEELVEDDVPERVLAYIRAHHLYVQELPSAGF